MTNQEIIEKFESDKVKASLGIAGGVFVQTDLVHEIIKALKQEPYYNPDEWCHDCSEYDHEKHCCRICMENNLCYRSKETCEDLRLFDELPSVTQKPGKWIYKNLKGQYCSVCDEQSVWKFNYCPNCGAKMVESQESEEEQCGK